MSSPRSPLLIISFLKHDSFQQFWNRSEQIVIFFFPLYILKPLLFSSLSLLFIVKEQKAPLADLQSTELPQPLKAQNKRETFLSDVNFTSAQKSKSPRFATQLAIFPPVQCTVFFFFLQELWSRVYPELSGLSGHRNNSHIPQ